MLGKVFFLLDKKKGSSLRYSSVDSAFEKRVADSGPLDSFSGMDHDKLANKPGEFYSPDTVPVVDVTPF